MMVWFAMLYAHLRETNIMQNNTFSVFCNKKIFKGPTSAHAKRGKKGVVELHLYQKKTKICSNQNHSSPWFKGFKVLTLK